MFSGAGLARDVSEPLTATSLNEYMDMEAVENSELLDLTGDYSSLVRNYMHGRCTIGISATHPALRTLAPPTIAQQQIIRWNLEVNAAAQGQFVYTHLYGMGPYIPVMVKI